MTIKTLPVSRHINAAKIGLVIITILGLFSYPYIPQKKLQVFPGPKVWWGAFTDGSAGSKTTFEYKNKSQSAIECVFGELLQGCSTEREISVLRSYWDNVPKVNETNVWIDAGEYSGRNNLISKGVGLIDTVILVLAKRAKSSVWTLDKKLLKLLNKELVFNS